MSRSKLSLKSRTATELELLRFLCDSAADLAARSAILKTLDDYAWSCNDYNLFFECIHDLAAREPHCVLVHLPAALTTRGFPDMPCEILSAPTQLDPVTAQALAKALLHLNRQK